MPEKKDKNVKRKVRFSEDEVDMPRPAVTSPGAATSLATSTMSEASKMLSLLKTMNSKLDNQAVITHGLQNEVLGFKGDFTAVRNDVDHLKESQKSLRKIVGDLGDRQKAVDSTLKHFKKEMDDALTRLQDCSNASETSLRSAAAMVAKSNASTASGGGKHGRQEKNEACPILMMRIFYLYGWMMISKSLESLAFLDSEPFGNFSETLEQHIFLLALSEDVIQ